MRSAVMQDPNLLKLLCNNYSKFSTSELRCAQSIIAVLSTAVSVLKNFVEARRELQFCLNDRIAAVQKTILHAEEIRWYFNPPSAPHFGGPWDRMIQTAKRTLLIILGSQKLTLEFFTTILAETELMLNSRPLTHVNEQSGNGQPLTPNHFLLHRPFANIPPIGFKGTDKQLSFNSWKEVQKVSNHFGNDSWRSTCQLWIDDRNGTKQRPLSKSTILFNCCKTSLLEAFGHWEK